jgi:iron complex transport system substrate-binding protein
MEERRSLPQSTLPVQRALALFLAAAFALTPTPSRSQPVAHRVVSLIPSLTEDLFALGAGADVVGVSEYSDYPAAAKKLPHVASYTSVDAERIVAMHPDLIVGDYSQESTIQPLLRAKLHVELFHEDSVTEVYAVVQRLGVFLGREAQADALVANMRTTSARLMQHLDRSHAKSVFVVLDIAPIYTVGKQSYINTLIEMAGGRNAADVRQAYGRYTAEAVLALQPDVIVVDPAVGFQSVENREPWRSLRAVQRGNVEMIPDPGILLHPSPRYNLGLKWLIDVLARAKS